MDTSVCRTTCQSVCPSTSNSVAMSVCTLASPSIIPVCPSYDLSIHHPVTSSMTHQSITPPISPKIHPSDCPTSSDHYSTIYTSLSDHLSCDSLYDAPTSSSSCLSPSNHLYDAPTSPSACLPLPDRLYDPPISLLACLSPSNCLTTTTTRLPICPSSHTIHCTQDSSQSLAVMSGEQSSKAKKFHRAFTDYDLLLHALDVSSIYLSDSRHVAPPKSGRMLTLHMEGVILVELP